MIFFPGFSICCREFGRNYDNDLPVPQGRGEVSDTSILLVYCYLLT